MKKSLLILGSLVLMMGLLAGCSGADLQGNLSDRGTTQKFDAAVANLNMSTDGKFRAEFVNKSNVSSETPMLMEISVDGEKTTQQVVFGALEEATLITPIYISGNYGVTACIGHAEKGGEMSFKKDADPSNNCLTLQVGE